MTATLEAPPSFAASVDSSLPPGYDGRKPPARKVSARSLVEREYTLETGGKPWAFLKVNCRPGPATNIPSFIQGEPLTGTVELHLAKTEHIRAVTIGATGESLSVGQDPIPFLAEETTLWSTSMGDPGTTGSDTGSAKLKGDYVWPFSITLPDKVTASVIVNGPGSEYPLPPSFSERASPAYLEYKLVVTFHRGRLRVDNTLSTSFALLPRSRTPAPSALRRLAYSENSVPPGPKEDPAGWDVLGPEPVFGTVFESRRVEVICSLALANPLSYARGTFIPFSLTLRSSDHQALDIFAARGSLAVRLMRILNVGPDATDPDGFKPKRTDNSFVACVGEGVYWLLSEPNAASEQRVLEGEVAVRGDLKPSFVFPRLCLKYYISFELAVPGFSPRLKGHAEPIFWREVTITTDAAPGPVPRSRVPPVLEQQATGTNYDVSIGMLTAANQRFVHHHGFS